MKKEKVVIDTNALISFVTDRNLTQQEKVAQLFEKAANMEVFVLCPQNVLTEFVYVLEQVYKIPLPLIKEMIADFIVMPGVEVVHDLDLNFPLSLWPERISDYGDAIVATASRTRRGVSIFTSDRKFKKVLKDLSIPLYPIQGNPISPGT